MNLEKMRDLIAPLERILETSSRSNLRKPQKYWYPLSLATYGLEEILEAIDSLCSFRTSMWEKTAEFEAQFARYTGSGETVMVNSGSSANLLLMFSLRDPAEPILRPGDEILVPAVTWPTQLWSVTMAGFQPVLVDVNPRTLNMDLSKAEELMNEKTKGLFLAHVMGNPCDMEQALRLCKSHGLLLLEDACEALGASYKGKMVGTWGLGGTFSFFFSHHITTMEGGMLVCNNPELADRFRALRAHGWIRDQRRQRTTSAQPRRTSEDPRYTFINWGFSMRPTELQAAFGIQQLIKSPFFEARRADLADRLRAFLNSWKDWLKVPEISHGAKPCWFAFPILVAKEAPFTRDQIAIFLDASGVETRPILAGNIARQPIMKHFKDIVRGELPGADEVNDCGFYVGLSPVQDDSCLARLKEIFDKFLKRY